MEITPNNDAQTDTNQAEKESAEKDHSVSADKVPSKSIEEIVTAGHTEEIHHTLQQMQNKITSFEKLQRSLFDPKWQFSDQGLTSEVKLSHINYTLPHG